MKIINVNQRDEEASSVIKQRQQQNNKNKRITLIISMVIMLISATFNTISTKASNRVFLPSCDGCEAAFFEAPMLQVDLPV